MKKKVLLLILFIFALIIICLAFFNQTINYGNPYLVSGNGNLHVNGVHLYNKYNKKFQLKGISSHGIQWYSEIITYDNLKQLRDDCGINIFRIAVYPESEDYIYDFDTIIPIVESIIDNCIDLDLYVLVDWHVLLEKDPHLYKEDSKKFFSYISTKYKNCPNVIYEICNEPNGDNIKWDNIVSYANEIIPLIRKNSSKSLIIVGTPNWSKDILAVIDNPLNYKNIMYSYHFYSGSEDFKTYSSFLKYALNNNVPVFVSEWGMTDSTGDGKLYKNSTSEFLDYLDQNHISWINWSYSNKNESSAILRSDFKSNFKILDYLSESGVFLVERLLSTK